MLLMIISKLQGIKPSVSTPLTARRPSENSASNTTINLLTRRNSAWIRQLGGGGKTSHQNRTLLQINDHFQEDTSNTTQDNISVMNHNLSQRPQDQLNSQQLMRHTISGKQFKLNLNQMLRPQSQNQMLPLKKKVDIGLESTSKLCKLADRANSHEMQSPISKQSDNNNINTITSQQKQQVLDKPLPDVDYDEIKTLIQEAKKGSLTAREQLSDYRANLYFQRLKQQFNQYKNEASETRKSDLRDSLLNIGLLNEETNQSQLEENEKLHTKMKKLFLKGLKKQNKSQLKIGQLTKPQVNKFIDFSQFQNQAQKKKRKHKSKTQTIFDVDLEIDDKRINDMKRLLEKKEQKLLKQLEKIRTQKETTDIVKPSTAYKKFIDNDNFQFLRKYSRIEGNQISGTASSGFGGKVTAGNESSRGRTQYFPDIGRSSNQRSPDQFQTPRGN
ncbi:UNKNOWN [Stylonychia lemnae]|uniref:Uncharacterized protein n=1 Tax=Stylonychia lemnae TaxID=5949 RepID=A0A077ZMW3_STYLE|nr:UNKNOWN [Stylonychia lemnae]|eukprot:CDW71268.1 UNKNOWN [Stylonychia lemnae]